MTANPPDPDRAPGPGKGKSRRDDVLWDALIATLGSGGGLGLLIAAAIAASTNGFLWACGAALTVVTPIAIVLRRGSDARLSPLSRGAAYAVAGAAAASVIATGIYQEWFTPPSASCSPDGNVASAGGHTSPLTKVTTAAAAYKCATGGSAYIYLAPSSGNIVGRMGPETSIWVVCWARGKNQSIWYYTEADQASGAFKNTILGWGYMPGDDLVAHAQPDPAVPACPFGSS